MGFADMLYQMNVPYNSDKAIEMAEECHGLLSRRNPMRPPNSWLRKEAFLEISTKAFLRDQEGCAYRNATTTTIAPTGTLSIIAGCSSGIEPLFALSFVRHVMDNDELPEVNPYFEKVARERGFYSRELMDAIARKGTIKDMKEIPEDVRRGLCNFPRCVAGMAHPDAGCLSEVYGQCGFKDGQPAPRQHD